MNQDDAIKNCGISVLRDEAETVLRLSRLLDDAFAQACRLVASCRGRVAFMGIGKSAHIARKISSTLSSMGTASFFVHPTEAGHGDLGMIKNHDVAVILSNSGESYEIECLLPSLKKMGVPVIAISGRPQSRLVKASRAHLNTHVEREASPLGLAPSNSSAAALALGDALAIAVSQIKKFGKEDFARTHPHGQLGRRLMLRVDSLMRRGDGIPRVPSGALLIDTLCEISEKGMGMTLVVNDQGQAIGIFTDGDLRRALEKKTDICGRPVDELMTSSFHSVQAQDLAVDALRRMKTKSINSAPVLDENNKLLGAISLHILLQAGL